MKTLGCRCVVIVPLVLLIGLAMGCREEGAGAGGDDRGRGLGHRQYLR